MVSRALKEFSEVCVPLLTYSKWPTCLSLCWVYQSASCWFESFFTSVGEMFKERNNSYAFWCHGVNLWIKLFQVNTLPRVLMFILWSYQGLELKLLPHDLPWSTGCLFSFSSLPVILWHPIILLINFFLPKFTTQNLDW